MPQEHIDVSSFKSQYKTAIETVFPNEISVYLGGEQYCFEKSKITTRYGTNPNQPFSLYVPKGKDDLVLANANIIKEGKGGFSLTNLQDFSQAMNVLKYFSDPACVLMKHLVPCGFQVSNEMSQNEIYESARDCDSRSAFGSVTAFNKGVDLETAKSIMNLFTEVVVAPSYTEAAISELRKNEGTSKLNNALRIIQYNPDHLAKLPKFDGDDVKEYINLKMLSDGTMALETPFLTKVKSLENLIINPYIPGNKAKNEEDYVGQFKPSETELQDCLNSWYININVRSNGVVLMKNGRAISVGTGQQERIGAVEQAIAKAIQKGHSLEGAVLSSDAFFPSRDCIDYASKYGISTVMWPAGSLNDKDVIKAANEHHIALVVPEGGERCFLHI